MSLVPKVYMAKEKNVVSVQKTLFGFPVLGIIVSLVFFGVGYYLKSKGSQYDLSGGREVHLADYALYGKLSYISSAIVLLLSVSFNFWVSIRKKTDIFPDAKKSLSDLQDLAWREFEEYVWSLFSKLGYSIDSKNDPYEAGSDLKIRRDAKTSLVRCRKYYVRRVPFAMVKEFCEAVNAEPSIEKGYFITTGFFTREAQKFAVGKPVELIDGERLMNFVRIADSIDSVQEMSSIQNSPAQEGSLCTNCGVSIALRTAGCEASSLHLFRECFLSPECKGALRKE
jgi:HJR/Mrr/RecB family endonuclease